MKSGGGGEHRTAIRARQLAPRVKARTCHLENMCYLECVHDAGLCHQWQELEVPSLNRVQTYNGGDVERDVCVRVEVGLALGKARHKAGHVCAGLEAVNEHNLHRPDHHDDRLQPQAKARAPGKMPNKALGSDTQEYRDVGKAAWMPRKAPFLR